LEFYESLTVCVVPPEVKVLPSHVAHDSPPHRVVEIDHDELARHPQQAAKRGVHVPGRLGQNVPGERHLSRMPELRLEGALTGCRQPTLRVEQEDVRHVGKRLGEPKIHLHQDEAGAVAPQFEHARTSTPRR